MNWLHLVLYVAVGLSLLATGYQMGVRVRTRSVARGFKSSWLRTASSNLRLARVGTHHAHAQADAAEAAAAAAAAEAAEASRQVPLTTAEWVLGLSEALRASTPPVGVTPNWGRELAEAMVIVFGTGPAKVAPFRNLLAGYTTGVVPPADSWDLLNRLEGDPEAHVRLAEFLAAAHPFDYRHWMSTPGKLQLPLSAALGRGTARVDLTPAEYGHVQPVGEVLRIEQGGSTHQYGPGSPERYFVYPHESARPEPPHDAPPVEPDLKPDKLRAFGEGWLRAFDWAGLWEIKAGSLAEDREQIQRDKERVRARRDRSVMDTPLARLDARPGRVAGDEERVHAGGARPEPRV